MTRDLVKPILNTSKPIADIYIYIYMCVWIVKNVVTKIMLGLIVSVSRVWINKVSCI